MTMVRLRNALNVLDALATARLLDSTNADTWFGWCGPNHGIRCLICGRSMAGLPTPAPHAAEHLAVIGDDRIRAIESLVALMMREPRGRFITDRSIYRIAILEVLGDPIPDELLLRKERA